MLNVQTLYILKFLYAWTGRLFFFSTIMNLSLENIDYVEYILICSRFSLP